MTDRDSLQSGLDALAAMEAAAVTLLGVARQHDQDDELDFGEDAMIVLRAAQCQDEQHYHALLAAGGVPIVDSFTLPEQIVTDRTNLLIGILELKAIGIAGYMALAREWATRGDVSQVEIAYQMGAVEAQHLSLAQALVGVSPAKRSRLRSLALRRRRRGDRRAPCARSPRGVRRGGFLPRPAGSHLPRGVRADAGDDRDDDPAPTAGRAGQSGGDADSTCRTSYRRLVGGSTIEPVG